MWKVWCEIVQKVAVICVCLLCSIPHWPAQFRGSQIWLLVRFAAACLLGFEAAAMRLLVFWCSQIFAAVYMPRCVKCFFAQLVWPRFSAVLKALGAGFCTGLQKCAGVAIALQKCACFYMEAVQAQTSVSSSCSRL